MNSETSDVWQAPEVGGSSLLGRLYVQVNKMHAPYDKPHKVSFFLKSHQNTHNSVKYKVIWKWHFVMLIQKLRWISLSCISGRKWDINTRSFSKNKRRGGWRTVRDEPKGCLCRSVRINCTRQRKPLLTCLERIPGHPINISYQNSNYRLVII